jgi:tetratricopeptide (TPR) repeat protein
VTNPKFEPLNPDDFYKLPGPLLTLLEHYDKEDNFFRKVHRLIDAFEWAVKWHTVLTMSDMLREADLPDKTKVLLSSGLRTPSLGTWNMFFRNSMTALKSPSAPWPQWERLVVLEEKHQIVAFRNYYAHGGTPAEEECREDCEKWYPVLLQLIGSPLFTEVGLIVGQPVGATRLQGGEETPVDMKIPSGRAGALLPHGQVLDLWPLGVYRRDPKGRKGWGFYYFNALKSSRVEQLNYEMPSILRDRDLWEPFHEVLPLREWSRIMGAKLDLFRSKIETLTESFKGRSEERKHLKKFCLAGKGTCMLWGAPGIGKSALLAQVFKEMRAGITPEGDDEDVVYPSMIEYFIRRNTEYASRVKFLTYLNQKLDTLFSIQNIHVGQDESELSDNLIKRLNAIEDMGGKQDLVLFIDGLDEHPEMTRVIPDSRSWLKVIVSARPVEAVLDWWRGHDRERRSEETIGPMHEKDIRALLYGVVDKYQESFNETFVEEVKERSQGNPLYLKLLCDQIYDQGGRVGSPETLPKEMADLYALTIKRVSQGENGKHVLTVLRLLSEAKAPLSIEAMAAMLHEFDSQEIRSAIDGCRELLFEDPLTHHADDYQLFHESLREWLGKNHVKECQVMAKRLADFCFEWTHIEDNEARKYALAHAAEHLFKQKDHERLWALLQDENYRKAQIDTFHQYAPPFNAIKKGIDLYIQRDGETPEDDARLCWLALRAGELGHQARTNIHEAFEWIKNRPLDDPRRIEDALESLKVLNETEFFKATVFMLWLEVDRQAELLEVQRHPEYALRILEEADKRIPVGSGTVDWGDFLDEQFMAWWTKKILGVFRIANEGVFFRFISHLADHRKGEYVLQFEGETKIGVFGLLISMTETIGGMLDGIVEQRKYECFSMIASTLAQADGLENREQLFHLVLEAAGKLRWDFKFKALADIATAISRSGNEEQSKKILFQVLEEVRAYGNAWGKSEGLSAIAVAMAQVGEKNSGRQCFDEALEAAREIAGLDNRCGALAEIAIAMAQAGHEDESKKCLITAETEIYATCRAGYYPPLVFNTIASAASKIGYGDFANQCFHKALTGAEAIKDDFQKLYHRKLHAVTDILAALADADGLDDRKALFQKAQRILDTFPNETSSKSKSRPQKSLASGMAKIGDFHMALTLSKSIVEEYFKLKAIEAIGETIARADYEGELKINFDRLMEVMEEFRYDNLRAIGLSSIAVTMSKAGHYERADQCLKAAMKSAEAIRGRRTITISTIERRAITLSTIAFAMSQAGNDNRAKLCFCQCLAGQDMISDDYHNSMNIVGIARSLTQAGHKEQSEQCLSKAIETTELIQNFYDQSKSLLALAEARAEVGMFHSARNLAKKISYEDLKSQAFSVIASKEARSGDLHGAISLISSNVKYRDFHRAKALSSIASAMSDLDILESRGDISFHKLQMSAEMIRSEYSIPERLKTFAAIASAMKRAGLEGQSKRLFRQTLATAETENWITIFEKAETLAAIASAMKRAGLEDQSLQVFRKAMTTIEHISGRDKPGVLVTIAETMAECGYEDESKQAYHEAFVDLEENGTLYAKACCLPKIAWAMAKVGNDEDVRQLFDQSLEAAKELEDPKFRSSALSSVAWFLCKSGFLENIERLFQQALTTTEGIGSDEDRSKTLLTIASDMTQTGLEDRFKEYLESSSLPHGIWAKIVPEWQQTLIKNQPSRLDLLRKSLGFFAFDQDAAYEGGYHFIQQLILNNQFQTVNEIVRQCPQLELSFLLKEGEDS